MTDNSDYTIYAIKNNQLIVPILVKPQAKQNQIVGIHANKIKIAIVAPPVEGKANKELINFLANKLNIKKNEVIILKGVSSMSKILVIPLNSKEKLDNLLVNFFQRS